MSRKALFVWDLIHLGRTLHGYLMLLTTGSLDNAIREFSLA